MEILLRYLQIYLSILLGSTFIANIFNKKIESCIIIDILLKMVLLYLFGLIHQLFIGVIIINLLSIIIGVLSIVKNRKKENFKENILTNGLLFFTIIYFMFIIFTFHASTNVWDEYSYWSLISKKMYYTNELISSGMHSLYPPFPTLWQYFFTKTLNYYSQGIELFAHYILAFALLMPLFEKARKDKKSSYIVITIAILCIPAIFNYIILYQAIYADVIIGLLIGYIFYEKYQEKNSKFLILSLTLSFIILTLTKATGFYIAIILIVINILNDILNSQWKGKKIIEKLKSDKRIIGLYLLIIIVILLFYISWNLLIYHYPYDRDPLDKEYEQYLDEKIEIKDGIKTIFTTIFGSNPNSVNRDSSNRHFFSALYTKYSIMQPIRISLLGFLFIYIIINMLCYQFLIKQEEKKKYKNMIITIIIGSILYLLLLQLSYLVKFSISEALTHASLERYIDTYYLGMFVFLFVILLEYIKYSNKNVNFKYYILILSILLITPLNIIAEATVVSGNKNAINQSNVTQLKHVATSIKETLSTQDRLCIVNQTSDKDYLSLQLKYFLVPEVNARMIRKFEKSIEGLFQNESTLEKWEKDLYDEYDYLYIINIDDYFKEFASTLFENQQIEENTMYKIEKQQEHILLIKVEKK